MRIFTLIILYCYCATSAFSQIETVATSAVGEYVRFGKYYNDTIIWRIIKKNSDNSAMLLSEKILCIKPFDAKGDLSDGRGSMGGPGSRITKGSNYWASSNIREWLNSSATSVSYSSNPPKPEYTMSGLNSYADEPGFLTNFTSSEYDLIMDTRHKSLLASVDAVSGILDGGTAPHIDDTDLADVVQNFDDAYYQMVTDKVFLLDVKELYYDVWTNDALGGIAADLQLRKPTALAVAHSEYISSELNTDMAFNYFLRTPNCNEENTTRSISPATPNKVHSGSCFSSNGGILPALNISADTRIYSGDGSVMNPYIISGETPASKLNIGISKKPFYLYPNPTSGVLNIATAGSEEFTSIELCDIFGNIIKKWDEKSLFHTINLDDQYPGIYVISISTLYHKYVVKVVLSGNKW